MEKKASSKAKQPKRRNLNRKKITQAVLAVMREHGADEITMRRIAEPCDTTAMALYHHVPDKSALISLGVDALFFEVASEPRRGGTWKEQLSNMWVDIRAKLLAVPGAGEVFVRQPVVGPGTALATEEMFRLLDEGGLSPQDVAQVSDSLTMLSLGSIANELTRPKNIRDHLPRQIPDQATPYMDKYIGTYSRRNADERYVIALNRILDAQSVSRFLGTDLT